MSDDLVEKRLDRVEIKAEQGLALISAQLQAVLVSLARVEERQSQFDSTLKLVMSRIDSLVARIEAVEKDVARNSNWSGIWSKSIWIIAAAAMGAAINQFVKLP